MRFAALIGAIVMLSGAAFWRRPTEPTSREEYVLVIRRQQTEPAAQERSIALFTGEKVQSLPMEEYLLGVVLTEMPPSFPEEALKAQAVAARTYAALAREKGKHRDFDLCAEPGCCQAWRSETQLRQDFGNAYDDYVQKGRSAVEKTAGEVLMYQDALIDAVYFSCSGGSSEPAAAVWGADVPYLQAVASPGEEAAAHFCTRQSFSFSEFRRIVTQAQSQAVFGVIPQDWAEAPTLSAGGGVVSMVLGGCEFSGTQIRKMFSLPSTKFELQVGNGEMLFTSYGYGHRVGMSQYGAKAMAESGAGYRQILQHYYTDVSIKKLSR